MYTIQCMLFWLPLYFYRYFFSSYVRSRDFLAACHILSLYDNWPNKRPRKVASFHTSSSICLQQACASRIGNEALCGYVNNTEIYIHVCEFLNLFFQHIVALVLKSYIKIPNLIRFRGKNYNFDTLKVIIEFFHSLLLILISVRCDCGYASGRSVSREGLDGIQRTSNL